MFETEIKIGPEKIERLMVRELDDIEEITE